MNKIDQLIERFCPNGVEYVELGLIAKILNGYSFKSGKYVTEGIRVIRISDVQKGKISDMDLKFYPIEYMNEINNYLLNEGDLVMSLTGNVGRVAMLSKDNLPAGLNQRVACIRSKSSKVKTKFLFYLFDQDKFEIEATTNATGGGQKNLSTTWLSKYKIPIPPIEIQDEIVNILDTFTILEFELEAELKERKEQFSHYKDQLLSCKGKEVEWKTLGDIGKFVRGNGLQKKDFIESGVGCIHYGQIYTHYGTIATKTKTFVSNELAKKLKKASKNDLIIAGVSENVVDVCKSVVWLGDEDICISGDSYIFKHKLNPIYIAYLFQTNRFLEFKKKNAQGAKVTRLKSGSLPKYVIPVPSLETQEKIANILGKMDSLVNDINIGLPAEIKARKKQCDYYRNRLLTFKNVSNE